AADEEYLTTFEINQYNGVITLTRTLDYEKHSYYQFKVMAEDTGGLKADPAGFVVYVFDVQDSPPNFINLPYSIQIDEDVLVGTLIQKVVAVDGDRGIPNNITYTFETGDYENFQLDPKTGQITVKKPLDRDSVNMRNTGGVYAMNVKAAEVVPPGQENYGETTATTLVTITVRDVNDNGPTFNQRNYSATILENMQHNVPVSFQGSMMVVSDIDQGTNSHFSLSFQKDGQPYYDFSPLPQEIYSESSVLIRVNNSNTLDYEKSHRVVFEVVARELDTTEKRSSTATVTIDTEDMNDNAPVFEKTDYTLTVKENTSIGMSVAQFNASDADSGTYGKITYSLRGGNGKFAIDQTTGVLRVTDNIDREQNEEFYLTVEAKDGGGLRTPAEVTVTVLDENDNKPVFRRNDYEGIVKEKAATFQRPLRVEAFDSDEANTNNSKVSYRLAATPPGLATNFSINASTGEIMLTHPLDYEKLNSTLNGLVTLTVEAYDAGSPRMFSQVLVNITVEDINDFAPVFSQSEYSSSIPENSQEVSAVDYDGTNPNNDLIYRIESGALDKFRINFKTGEVQVDKGAELDRETRAEYVLTISAIDRGTPSLSSTCTLKKYFGINSNTGEVFVLNNLDRETAVRVILEIIVHDKRATVGDQTAKGTLSVRILDYNDNAPVFLPSSTYKVNVSEADSAQSILLQVSAIDVDEGQTVSYSIGNGTVNSFAISSDGTIHLISMLDRETHERVEFQVIAKDNGVPPLVSTATVSVLVLDANDNQPVFSPYNITFKTSEDAIVGSVVTTFIAADKDSGDFGKVFYKLAGPDSAEGSFVIGEDSGKLTVAKQLDRETKAEYRFEIVVTVVIADVDDNPPIFTSVVPQEPAVPESLTLNQTVATVAAEDADDKNTDSGLVLYYLTSETNATRKDNSTLFKVDSKTGEIKVASLLKGYSGIFYVTVMATNKLQNFRPTKRIVIKILDVNDYHPKFVKPNMDGSLAYVLENSEKGTSVFTLEAVDEDTGPNGEIHYSIIPNSNNKKDGSNTFEVDALSGLITTKGDLNAEVLDRYELTIQATDQGYPDPFSTSVTLFIVVLDKNDHKPEFSGYSAPYFINMVENKAVCANVSLAIDRDLNTTYTSICYYLIGSSLMDTFMLNTQTGMLCLNKTLDRETTPMADIVIQALEDCYRSDIKTDKIHPLEPGELYPPMYQPSNTDKLWIEIQFHSKDLALGVTRVTQYGKFILDLNENVADPDSPRWGVDYFIATSNFTANPEALKQEIEGLGIVEPFKLFRNGSVKTNMYFQPQMSGSFLVDLKVFDKGGLWDSAKLRISLISDDQRLIIVFRRKIDNVAPVKDDVASHIGSKVGCRIVVDSIQTHESETGQAELGKTDMFIHGEDISTNEVIPAEKLLSMIDQKSTLLMDLLNNYNILQIVLSRRDKTANELQERLKMALILVSVILGAICIILSVVLCYIYT
ncbi:unnamed protein product, partial [Candidula unifasciata]